MYRPDTVTTSLESTVAVVPAPEPDIREPSLLDESERDRERLYVSPSALIAEIRADPLPLEPQVLDSFVERRIECTELMFLSEIYDGERVRMHAWLCRQHNHPEPVTPVLLIPGGLGATHGHTTPRWIAAQTPAAVLAVDWIGAGKSDAFPGIDPWLNAMRFDGDYRHSHQYHNLRALLRATELLLAQPSIEADRLVAMGGSWGGFYSWLLAGVDERFTHILPTFGCGFHDTETRSVWQSHFASLGPEKTERWLQAFDPGRRAHLIKAKVYYQQALNDRFYSAVQSMETYRRVRTDKRLLLTYNQDHVIEPFGSQDVLVLSSIIEGRDWDTLPDIHSVTWCPGTSEVEIDVHDEPGLTVSVVYSCGAYTHSFARLWREARAELRNGRWVAEIPVVDPAREIWFYGHAVVQHAPRPRGASTAIQRVIPAEIGVKGPTAAFADSFDFSGADFWELPIGDRHGPSMRLVDDGGGRPAVAISFNEVESFRGVAYCLEGDLLAKLGYDAIEVRLRIPDAAALGGLKLCLVTDFNALAEQDYVLDLDQLGLDFTEWQTVRAPFADFRVAVSQRYDFYQPPMEPMDIARICAVGLYHGDLSYVGEAILGPIRLLKS